MSRDTLYRSRVPQRPLRASALLSYLGFIRLLELIWSNAHPDVPFMAAGLPVEGRYPCVVYSLENRTPHPNEPKPRQREVLLEEDSDDVLIISAQRFNNWVKFTVVDEGTPDGAQMAEALIEDFEDFMMEHTPLLKYKGLSDLMYMRRVSDEEESRSGKEGVVKRSVVYSITTEKQIETSDRKMQEILATISVIPPYSYDSEMATPETVTPNTFPPYPYDDDGVGIELMNGLGYSEGTL